MRDTKRSRRTWAPSPRAETYNEMKARLQNDVAVHALKARLPRPFSVQVRMSFVWFEEERRRDPDNVRAGGTKLILDALVACGVLSKDGVRNIAGFDGDDYVYGEGAGVQVSIRSLVSGLTFQFFVPHRLPEFGALQKGEARGARRSLARSRR